MLPSECNLIGNLIAFVVVAMCALLPFTWAPREACVEVFFLLFVFVVLHGYSFMFVELLI